MKRTLLIVLSLAVLAGFGPGAAPRADAADPIPAPGIYDRLDELQAHTVDAMHATTTARILVDDLADDLAGADEAEIFEAVIAAVGRAAMAAVNGGRAIRKFVHIGLGVAQHADDDDDTEMIERSLASHPAGRLTTPEDVARCLIPLCDPRTSWMTGNTIRIDGCEDLVG